MTACAPYYKEYARWLIEDQTDMKKYIWAIPLLLCSTAIAQERTAGSTIETQMTWSTLSTQIKAASARTEIVNSRVDQAVVCGKQGMVYAPDAPGNVNGCLPPKIDVNLTKLVANIINCNKVGKMFNGSTCVAINSTVPVGSLCGMSSYSWEEGQPLLHTCAGHDPKYSCPVGYSRKTTEIWGGSHGQSFATCYKD